MEILWNRLWVGLRVKVIGQNCAKGLSSRQGALVIDCGLLRVRARTRTATRDSFIRVGLLHLAGGGEFSAG